MPVRAYGARNPTDQIPLPPAVVHSFVMTGGSSAQAADWVGSTVGSSAVSAQMVHVTGVTTLGVPLGFWVNVDSTRASVPSSGLSSGSSASVGNAVIGERTLQVPGGSTGFSVASLIPGYVQVEVYKR